MKKAALLLIAAGLLAAATLPAPAAPDTPASEVHFDAASGMPRDATALCADGSWSSSHDRSGTCSAHGGVSKWFGKAPKKATFRCKDGTYSKAKDSQGACSQHGGVAFEIERAKPAK